LLVAGAACGPADERTSPVDSTITMAYCCGADALNPMLGLTSQFLLFAPLVAYDERGDVEGRLAYRWEHSQDYLDWTYHLRTDVRWHDGVPFTAHDVEFSFHLLTHPDVYYYTPGSVSAEALNDSTVTVRYHHPIQAGGDAWTVYLPKHLLEQLDPAEVTTWEFWRRPVGNGPYRFVRYVPETATELQRNLDYYRLAPAIERVVLKFTAEAALAELLGGGVDMITFPQATPRDVPKVVDDPRFRVYHQISPLSFVAIYWQNGHPLFRDPRVRHALTAALDRREIRAASSLPETIPLVDGLVTSRQFLRGDLPAPLPHDRGLAEGLLEEAGWHDPDGDGIRGRDGANLQFTVLTDGTAGSGEKAVLIQDQLRRVGVRAEIQTLEFTLAQERLRAGDFEAAITMFYMGLEWLEDFLGAGSPLGYHNPAVEGLLERGLETADPDTKDQLYLELTEIFRADLPVTLLHPWATHTIAHRRVQGLSSPWDADPLANIEKLWIEEPE
jgi:peptide/nickel transport system substrate-binding protein